VLEEEPKIEACFARLSSFLVSDSYVAGYPPDLTVTLESDLKSVIIRRGSEEFALIGEFVIDLRV